MKKPLDALFGIKSADENQEDEALRQKDQEKKRKKGMYSHNVFSPGLGLFSFTFEGFEDYKFYALHQAIGTCCESESVNLLAVVIH